MDSLVSGYLLPRRLLYPCLPQRRTHAAAPTLPLPLPLPLLRGNKGTLQQEVSRQNTTRA